MAQAISVAAVGGVDCCHRARYPAFFILGPVAGVAAAMAVVGFGLYLFRLLRQWATDEQAAQTVSQAGQTAASVASYPTSSNFVLSTPGSSFVPTLGGTNSRDGRAFQYRAGSILPVDGRAVTWPPNVRLP